MVRLEPAGASRNLRSAVGLQALAGTTLMVATLSPFSNPDFAAGLPGETRLTVKTFAFAVR